MNVLVIGRGAREHAIAFKFANSSMVSKVYVAPGNEGMKDIAIPVSIYENNFKELIAFVKKEKVDLTFVGPEVPLMNGIVDEFQKENLCIFGPTESAAIIEGSKSFAKDLMKKYNIPTAEYKVFTKYEEALEFIDKLEVPIVLKADGLVAGKGVIIAMTKQEAKESLRIMMNLELFGEASRKVVIEEFLEGEEFSFMAFVSGEKVYPMTIARDYKRAFDNDKGPNTGGMGAYSPVDQIPDEVVKESLENILIPTAKAMVSEGRSFTGILYAGLILTKNGAKVIEFNARFGDPETEVVLPRLENDLFDVINKVIKKEDINLTWSSDYAMGVMLASKGYPSEYTKGSIIHGLDRLEDTMLYHAGTDISEGNCITNGGRVLFLGSKGKTLAEARKNVYKEIEKIKCDNLFYRSDIGDTLKSTE